MATQAQLDGARRMVARLSREEPASQRIGKSGRHTMRVPAVAYWNAVEGNGGVGRDGKTCWDDPGFRADMRRRHPEVCVRQSGRILVGAAGAGGSVRNRYGKVTWSKSYGAPEWR